MSLSPYHTVINPPIHDLEEYKRDLRQSRSRYESGEPDNYAEGLFECGENLLEHCDFLDQKLKIKVRVHWWINMSTFLSEILYSGKTANEEDMLPM